MNEIDRCYDLIRRLNEIKSDFYRQAVEVDCLIEELQKQLLELQRKQDNDNDVS